MCIASQHLTVDNPNYWAIVNHYDHLKGVQILDTDTKEKLPVHIVLGKNVFSRIRKPMKPLIGDETKPIIRLVRLVN